MRTVAWVAGISRLSKADLYAASLAAQKIGSTEDALLTVMQFESGLSPSARNATSGATGLIQFMPATAKALGVTCPELALMSFQEQLPFVVRYMGWFSKKGPLDTVEKLYCAVFWPAAINKTDDHVIARRPPKDLPKEQWTFEHKAYMQNAGFDKYGNKDGVITRAEICRPVKAILAEAASRPRIDIEEPQMLSREEQAAAMALVTMTIQENLPDPLKVTFPDDDEPPPTVPNA